jgi:hypothetical protein
MKRIELVMNGLNNLKTNKMKKTAVELLQKIKSIKLCLMAHPDNEVDSEFADRISDLEDIEFELEKEQKMNAVDIEKLNQLISRTDMSGNDKVKWLVDFIDGREAEQETLQEALLVDLPNGDDFFKEAEYTTELPNGDDFFKNK